jgi:hypothetical protein
MFHIYKLLVLNFPSETLEILIFSIFQFRDKCDLLDAL